MSLLAQKLIFLLRVPASKIIESGVGESFK
jgi:hypothetical protein